MFNFFIKTNIKKFNRNIHTIKYNHNIDKVLGSPCINFIEKINNKNNDEYNKTLQLRNKINENKNYKFRNDTKEIRESNWQVNELPENLRKRHVEIISPGNNRKMIIDSLNSNANTYILDLEDSMTPSWNNIINGHNNINLAITNNINHHEKTISGIKKINIENLNKPNFFVKTRGLHMKEENLSFDNKPISATIFDISTFLFNNANILLENNKSPNLYIPKLESYEDALFISKIISDCEKELAIPKGCVKVTCLIETYPAIFQTNEIIYALKDNIVALNCGKWDYIFSMIKCLSIENIMEQRNKLNMNEPFLKSYVNQIVNTCHNRGILAIGGLSNLLTNNDENNIEILEKIVKEKEIEIIRGCDGTLISNLDLLDPIKKLFESKMNENQLNFISNIKNVGDNLSEFDVPLKVTEDVLRKNINISLQYISAWLSGNGVIVLNNLMENLATQEILLFQIKQWLIAKHLVEKNENEYYDLDKDRLFQLIDNEFDNLLLNNQVKYTNREFNDAKDILKEYTIGNYKFLTDVGIKYLNMKNNSDSGTWNDY